MSEKMKRGITGDAAREIFEPSMRKLVPLVYGELVKTGVEPAVGDAGKIAASFITRKLAKGNAPKSLEKSWRDLHAAKKIKALAVAFHGEGITVNESYKFFRALPHFMSHSMENLMLGINLVADLLADNKLPWPEAGTHETGRAAAVKAVLTHSNYGRLSGKSEVGIYRIALLTMLADCSVSATFQSKIGKRTVTKTEDDRVHQIKELLASVSNEAWESIYKPLAEKADIKSPKPMSPTMPDKLSQAGKNHKKRAFIPGGTGE